MEIAGTLSAVTCVAVVLATPDNAVITVGRSTLPISPSGVSSEEKSPIEARLQIKLPSKVLHKI